MGRSAPGRRTLYPSAFSLPPVPSPDPPGTRFQAEGRGFESRLPLSIFRAFPIRRGKPTGPRPIYDRERPKPSPQRRARGPPTRPRRCPCRPSRVAHTPGKSRRTDAHQDAQRGVGVAQVVELAGGGVGDPGSAEGRSELRVGLLEVEPGKTRSDGAPWPRPARNRPATGSRGTARAERPWARAPRSASRSRRARGASRGRCRPSAGSGPRPGASRAGRRWRTERSRAQETPQTGPRVRSDAGAAARSRA